MSEDFKLKNKYLQIRLSEEEYEIVEKKANHLGLGVTGYIRLVCIHLDINKTLSKKIKEDPGILTFYSDRNRHKSNQTKVTEEEYEIVEEKANYLDLSISDYVRVVSCFANVYVSMDESLRDI